MDAGRADERLEAAAHGHRRVEPEEEPKNNNKKKNNNNNNVNNNNDDKIIVTTTMIEPEEEPLWLRTNGVSTNGASAKVMSFDGLGKKVRPGTFGMIEVG